MQASRPIHVADRSTAFMGLQFADPAYNRPVSSGPGESRRMRARIPGIVWLVVGVALALAVFYVARQVILPFVLALFLTYLLLPLVNVMHSSAGGRRGTPRAIASFLALADSPRKRFYSRWNG